MARGRFPRKSLLTAYLENATFRFQVARGRFLRKSLLTVYSENITFWLLTYTLSDAITFFFTYYQVIPYSSTYSLTYLCIYLLTYLIKSLTYLSTHLLICLFVLITYSPTIHSCIIYFVSILAVPPSL